MKQLLTCEIRLYNVQKEYIFSLIIIYDISVRL